MSSPESLRPDRTEGLVDKVLALAFRQLDAREEAILWAKDASARYYNLPKNKQLQEKKRQID